MKLSGQKLGMICTNTNVLHRGREHLEIQIQKQIQKQILIHIQLQIQEMQAMEEENPADNINGEVEERVRSDSAASGNHDNDAFDEILSQGWDEQDALKDILFRNLICFGRVRLS